MALAKLCYETLISDGIQAKLALEAGVCTPSVEKIIEANTLLSGLGFESGGLAAAHAIHNGLTVLEDCHHMYHGEKVAFGTITQLVMENAPKKSWLRLSASALKQGLPVTLAELGIKNTSHEKIMAVAEAASAREKQFTTCRSPLRQTLFMPPLWLRTPSDATIWRIEPLPQRLRPLSGFISCCHK